MFKDRERSHIGPPQTAGHALTGGPEGGSRRPRDGSDSIRHHASDTSRSGARDSAEPTLEGALTRGTGHLFPPTRCTRGGPSDARRRHFDRRDTALVSTAGASEGRERSWARCKLATNTANHRAFGYSSSREARRRLRGRWTRSACALLCTRGGARIGDPSDDRTLSQRRMGLPIFGHWLQSRLLFELKRDERRRPSRERAHRAVTPAKTFESRRSGSDRRRTQPRSFGHLWRHSEALRRFQILNGPADKPLSAGRPRQVDRLGSPVDATRRRGRKRCGSPLKDTGLMGRAYRLNPAEHSLDRGRPRHRL
ncbi:MAG: hypothetical protein EA397_15430 [Deltaproteobacteria bacterium]|nr:MAG: hypothetical protein EA397_15430 [Deltaproteobacteria bacterium]